MTTQKRQATARRSDAAVPLTYWSRSHRPLHILVFLLPLIVAYELGLALVLRSDHGVLSNVAHIKLLEFFETFGIAPTSGLFLGGIVIVVVLLIWHVLLRDSWHVDFKTIGIMAIESIVLVIPLIVLGQFVARTAISAMALGGGEGVAGTTEQQLAELDLWSQLTVSIGAGLYEELVFRMLLIFVIHTLLVDLIGASHRLGSVIAIVVSAAAFTWYHPLEGPDGALSVQRLAFFFLAGLYFGVIFVARGFGIVVGVHALYDILMVTTLDGS